jgi:hypothetical protein
MTSHQITVAVWILLGLIAVALEAAARLPKSRIPRLGTLLGAAMRTRSGRVGILAAWLWIGLHFFAR